MNRPISRTSMILRLTGDLPTIEELTRLLATAPTRQRRKGELGHLGRQQPFDMWILMLIERSEWEDGPPLPEAITRVVETLQHLTPGLVQLQRGLVKAELWISTIRQTDQGGFDIPADIVAAAGAAQLSIAVSVLVILDDEDEEDGRTEGNTGDEDGEDGNA